MSNYNPTYTTYLMNRYGVAWYKFDETVATSVVDSKGTSVATVNGTTVIPGITGKARSFNGTSDFIKFNGNPVIPAGAKSIRLRMRFPTTLPSSNAYPFMTVESYASQHGLGCGVELSTGRLFFNAGQAQNALRFQVFTPNNICDGQWHDYLFTWDGTKNTNAVKLYVDDMKTPVAQATSLSEETTPYFTGGLTIGRAVSASFYAKFDLDSFEIYNSVIDPITNKFVVSSEDTTYSFYKKVGMPLIPVMDRFDNEIGSAIGSASYSTGYTWKAFDNDGTTYYGTNFIPDSSKPVYIGYKFNEPVCVKRYSFLAGLRTFKFMASNNGTSWDILDTKTSLISNTSTIQTFDVQNEKKYSYYKLEATLVTSGNAWITIYFVQFYGLMPPILLEIPSNEINYIQKGMDKGFQMDINEELNIREYNKHDSIQFESGKLFKQKIDTSQLPIKSVSIT
ncbi:LamG-like jellyroll fold domain-containing protein [Paenibacillus sp. TSA_86.1]|uniref:LamG-like jellyroll fold domain-containing protein n=1 Tax=Paenibacillus sp. TSA_86.1 TaxID=3415649 RepID=UPI004045606C